MKSCRAGRKTSQRGGYSASIKELKVGLHNRTIFQGEGRNPFKVNCRLPWSFFDLLRLFGADDVEGFSTYHALMMYPLPMLRIVILYSETEEGMESTLRVLFDSTAIDYPAPEVITLYG